MNPFEYDFGYGWQYSYIHVVPLVLGALIAYLSWRFRRSRWLTGIGVLVAVWGLIGLWILQYAIRINLPLELPTERFLASGGGRVLDVGAGSGRASIAVLRERPQTTVVALDWFKEGFGIEGNAAERVFRNAEIAGARERIDVQSADMCDMPFEADSFDAAISSYAIDHMRRENSERALSEIHRVLRPGGEFLLAVARMDGYVRVALPIVGAHGYLGR
jgi:SAM-dependent methyltransferase